MTPIRKELQQLRDWQLKTQFRNLFCKTRRFGQLTLLPGQAMDPAQIDNYVNLFRNHKTIDFSLIYVNNIKKLDL